MAMHFVSSNGTDTNDTYTQLSSSHVFTSPSCFLRESCAVGRR
ncbi:hypothetical protein ARMA_0880 [Ardenticatena maritima]|uniref:Uncharacterized protein n=1 Tax=Ardenticatena maritima TaxID=872965 RepID=A0A0N0RFE1_9CHLR|nr:hypothetical protein ARMA_0880 [Ardenticatena maritima]